MKSRRPSIEAKMSIAIPKATRSMKPPLLIGTAAEVAVEFVVVLYAGYWITFPLAMTLYAGMYCVEDEVM